MGKMNEIRVSSNIRKERLRVMRAERAETRKRERE